MSDDNPPSTVIFALMLCCLLIALPAASAAGVVEGYFKPGVMSGYRYTWHYRAWEDYCPACGHHDCLLMNPKGVPERELTCRYCGADYDGVKGWEKMPHPRWRLKRDTGGFGAWGVDLELVYKYL